MRVRNWRLKDRGPKTHPKSRNTKKTPRLRELFRSVRASFCLLPCDASQEHSGNCSEKLVQMNIFILGGFFRVDFPPLLKRSTAAKLLSIFGPQLSPRHLAELALELWSPVHAAVALCAIALELLVRAPCTRDAIPPKLAMRAWTAPLCVSIFLRHSSPRASVKCWFGRLSSGFYLFDIFSL